MYRPCRVLSATTVGALWANVTIGIAGAPDHAIAQMALDDTGGRIMRQTTRENVKKRMAMMLVERNNTVVLTWPVIQEEFGNRFQISGRMTTVEAIHHHHPGYSITMLNDAGWLRQKLAEADVESSRLAPPVRNATAISAMASATSVGSAMRRRAEFTPPPC